MTLEVKRGIALLAVAAIVALIGLPLALDESPDTQDLGTLAFALAIVMAVGGLAGIAKDLYGADRER